MGLARGLAVSERFAHSGHGGHGARDHDGLTLEVRATALGHPGAGHQHDVHIVAGTLDEEGRGQVVAIDGFPVALEPDGRLLLVNHRDQPGMIGAVGTLLGARGINIAGMQVGRLQVRGAAVMIVILDDPLPRAVLEELRAIPGLSHAHYVDLSED